MDAERAWLLTEWDALTVELHAALARLGAAHGEARALAQAEVLHAEARVRELSRIMARLRAQTPNEAAPMPGR